jgi:pyruvate-ferredoxin/flavodoxin oxidoreductase
VATVDVKWAENNANNDGAPPTPEWSVPMPRPIVTIDGNEAAAHVAHKTNEVIAIYPITPSSTMGELADMFSAAGRKNIFGTIPTVIEMQSEGGAAGALHGAVQTGALTTTFTASQGLLLMIPNMFKIAGELTPTVFHVSARTVATHALSIFGDHSDVMAVRSTGWAMLAANSPQEVMDFALIAQAATLEARVPFVHFFDGFRTSHEIRKIEQLTDDDIRAMIDEKWISAHRSRKLTPDKPVIRGTSQNPDVFFQAREACNPYYAECSGIVQQAMDRFADLVGRRYRLFDYVGAPDAERVIVMMGSGADVAEETVEHLVDRGEKVGLLKIRLFRPFSVQDFAAALPATTKTIAALDRTKEPGGIGEPLYQDVVTALAEAVAEGSAPFDTIPKVVGGRYGLSSKDFTPAMVEGVYQELAKPAPKNHFTVGIHDDVTNNSIDYDPNFSTEPDDVVRAMFYGLGSDGTVGANKNSIKIIGETTDHYAQGYFVYDSKKAGSVTVSHLRFGPDPIRSSYLIHSANFIGCHHFSFLEQYDMLRYAAPGATFLLNAPYGPEQVWDHLPVQVQREIIEKEIRVYVIDAQQVAQELGLGGRTNTIMQTCFFAISNVLPKDEAITAIKATIQKTYGKKGEHIVKQNWAAVDQALSHLHPVDVPADVTSTFDRPATVSADAPEFVRRFTAPIIAGDGDALPVSAMPCDGTFVTATAKWEKRNIAYEIPIWDPAICIQCGKCSMVCPHAAIRMNVYEPACLAGAPETFRSIDAKQKEYANLKFTIQVAPEDCTGCGACVHVCPAKNKSQVRLKAINMTPQAPLRDEERENFDFYQKIPVYDRRKLKVDTVKGSQFLETLFEYSGACSGCGETPYIDLVTKLFGDRTIIANATGCSSIYGGNLPTTPYTTNADGRGPAWSNSLFEDNAEFGLGFRLTLDKHAEYAREMLERLKDAVGAEAAEAILDAEQTGEAEIYEQRQRVEALKEILQTINDPEASRLIELADALVKKSVWIIGGDGWAYDIGFGGLDHVLASGRNVNLLVLDTEVYSNTGGQMSKSTPRAAVAKFAAGGKATAKKDLGMMAMMYGNVYVARIAMGASDQQTVKAIIEAERYDGPSLILAYSHCIAHGINMRTGLDQQKAAVACGHWPLYRYDPSLAAVGKNPMQLDSKTPTMPFAEYAYQENRYKMLTKSRPAEAERLIALSAADAKARWQMHKDLAAMFHEEIKGNGKGTTPEGTPRPAAEPQEG